MFFKQHLQFMWLTEEKLGFQRKLRQITIKLQIKLWKKFIYIHSHSAAMQFAQFTHPKNLLQWIWPDRTIFFLLCYSRGRCGVRIEANRSWHERYANLWNGKTIVDALIVGRLCAQCVQKVSSNSKNFRAMFKLTWEKLHLFWFFSVVPQDEDDGSEEGRKMKDKRKKKKKKPEIVEVVQYQKPEIYQLVEEADIGGHGGHMGHHGLLPHKIGGLHMKKHGRSIGGLFGRFEASAILLAMVLNAMWVDRIRNREFGSIRIAFAHKMWQTATGLSFGCAHTFSDRVLDIRNNSVGMSSNLALHGCCIEYMPNIGMYTETHTHIYYLSHNFFLFQISDQYSLRQTRTDPITDLASSQSVFECFCYILSLFFDLCFLFWFLSLNLMQHANRRVQFFTVFECVPSNLLPTGNMRRGRLIERDIENKK